MNRKANVSIAIIILVLLILLVMAVYFIFQSGIVEETFDLCQSTFEDCNYECGKGILSSVCKEKCTYNYRQCKNG